MEGNGRAWPIRNAVIAFACRQQISPISYDTCMGLQDAICWFGYKETREHNVIHTSVLRLLNVAGDGSVSRWGCDQTLVRFPYESRLLILSPQPDRFRDFAGLPIQWVTLVVSWTECKTDHILNLLLMWLAFYCTSLTCMRFREVTTCAHA